MYQNQELETSQQALKRSYIKQAIADGNFQYNPIYSPEDRELLTNHLINQELDKLGGKFIIEKGEPRLVQSASPGLDLFDQSQVKVTLQNLIPHAIGRLLVNGQPQEQEGETRPYGSGYGHNYQFHTMTEQQKARIDQIMREARS